MGSLSAELPSFSRSMAIFSLGGLIDARHDRRSKLSRAGGGTKPIFSRPTVVGIFVGTLWINILLRYGNFFENFFDLAAAEPTSEIKHLQNR